MEREQTGLISSQSLVIAQAITRLFAFPARERLAQSRERDEPGAVRFVRDYVFGRRGKGRDSLGENAAHAMRASLGLCPPNRDVDSQITRTVEAVKSLCKELQLPLPQTPLEAWVASSFKQSGNLGVAFEALVQLSGVGPKAASAFLRDTLVLDEQDESVPWVERHLLVPIDRAHRLFLEHLLPEHAPAGTPDWVLSGKMAKLARHAQVSAAKLSLTLTEYARTHGHVSGAFSVQLDRFADESYSEASRMPSSVNVGK